MRKSILIYVMLLGSTVSYSQVVGYQGRKLILQLGYAPANNISAILLDYNLADDHYTNDPDKPNANDPVLFKHIPKFELEYVVLRYGSVFFRYNPFSITSNIDYFDQSTGLTVDVVGGRSNGNMFSLGYRKYMNGNIAPLGSYFGLYGTLYHFKNAFVESRFSEHPVPESFLNYSVEPDHMFGLFGQFGVKNIYWDKLVLDIQVDGGYFFKNTDDYSASGYGDQFAPYALVSDAHIVYYTTINTRAYFFLTPSINVGFLF